MNTKEFIKKTWKIGIILLLAVLYITARVKAETTLSEPTFCCEKATSGAYCVNAPENQCATGYKKSPTSCDTTSYCNLGTCYDSQEGICMENTPQLLCNQNEGTWDPRPANEVAQCNLGCCIIADQAAFVSLVRCKKLSTYFGVENNYNTGITNELDCVATAQAQDMGACVYEKDFERVCEYTTRTDCGAKEQVITINNTQEGAERKFYKDMLCSAEELNTACARQTSTTCYEGDVYWVDSCGNRENVFSTNKEKSWNNGRATTPEEVCDPTDGSNTNCGNCDYFLGSRCEVWSGTLGIGKPAGANNICQKTECKDRNGNKRINGESWCVTDDPAKVGVGADEAGSRYYREICQDGDVVVEPCADYRNEVCLQDSIPTSKGSFSTAGCRVNRWQDCTLQTNKQACTNIDKRDCQWMPSVTGMILGEGNIKATGPTVGYSNPTATNNNFNNPTYTSATGNVIAPITGNAVAGSNEGQQNPNGLCVPKYSPGFDFWGGNKQTTNNCGLASAECTVVYEKGLFGGSTIIQGKECLEEQWALQANRVCTALGDCGAYTNFAGVFTDDGYTWKEDGNKKKFTPNAENRIISGSINAKVIETLQGEQQA